MTLLPKIVALLEASKYVLLFAGSYLEGSAVMMTGGLLWRLGTVAFWPMYIALLLGDFLSDLMWYFVGYFGARTFIMRWGHIVNATPAVIEKVERRFHRHHTWILIVSKLTMGFGLAVATLMTAGMMRVSLVRYIAINFLGGIVWILFLVFLGYHFGNLLAYIPAKLQLALAPVALVGAFFGLRYINKRLAESDW